MPTCHSTNDIALEWLEKPDTHEGCIVITDNQTAGRGQRGNSWISAPGLNLTFSIILKPTSLLIKDQFIFNMAVSLSIVDVLEKILPDSAVKIKWPNDIYVDEKKIGGILIENTLEPPFMKTAIVGIGLNVNQRKFTLEKITSLRLLTDKKFKLEQILENLILSLELRYRQLKAGNYELIRSDYLKHLLGYLQLRSFYSEFEFEAMIMGVTDVGKLTLKKGREIMEFDLKEIKFL
jgi:BirA family transcriptional regulator, biotin operon repressor / biotin---[acetyl-CoA-carboxylase] ligase